MPLISRSRRCPRNLSVLLYRGRVVVTGRGLPLSPEISHLRCHPMTGVVSWWCSCLGRNGSSRTGLSRTMLIYSIKRLSYGQNMIIIFLGIIDWSLISIWAHSTDIWIHSLVLGGLLSQSLCIGAIRIRLCVDG